MSISNNSKILFFPIGSHEYHGENLPLDTDTIIAEEIVKSLSRNFKNSIIKDSIDIGISTEHQKMPGTKSISLIPFVKKLLDDLSKHNSLKEIIVIINGHGGNISAINAVISEHNYSSETKAICPRIDFDSVSKKSIELLGDFDSHAGSFEASLLAHYGKIDEMSIINPKFVKKIPGSLKLFRMDELSDLGVIKNTSELIVNKKAGEILHNLIVFELTKVINKTSNDINKVRNEGR